MFMTLLLLLLQHGPSLAKTIYDIIQLIKKTPLDVKKEFEDEFGKAFLYFRATGNRERLKRLRQKLKERARGKTHRALRL